MKKLKTGALIFLLVSTGLCLYFSWVVKKENDRIRESNFTMRRQLYETMALLTDCQNNNAKE